MISNSKLLIVLLSLFSCASTQKLQEKSPVGLEEVYFQRWNAGIREAGYGYNIFIPVKENTTELDSIYFKDNVAKLAYNNNAKAYAGVFQISLQVNNDIILSNDLKNKLNMT